jgi:hypothetical protein
MPRTQHDSCHRNGSNARRSLACGIQLPLHTPSRTGVAAAEGGPDFWYSSMRGRPLRLLRSADTSYKPATMGRGSIREIDTNMTQQQ